MKKTVYRNILAALILSIVFICTEAQAGLLDKLNAMTDKLNEKTQKMQEKHTSSSGIKAGCENGRGGTTCLDALRQGNKCFDPLKGYQSKLAADLIEKKLKSEKNLSDKKRTHLEEDLAGLREAEQNGSDHPTIAGQKNSQRYLMDITKEEQIEINSAYTQFYGEITQKCQGRDFDGTGGRKTHYVQDNSRAMAERKQQDNAMSGMQTCMAQTQGLRWKVIADTMEKKMNTLKLSGKEKQEWEEDIALVREAGEKNLMMPQSSDPMKSMRYAQKLTMDEQLVVNTEYSQLSQQIIADCSSTAKKGMKTKGKDWSKHDGGLVDHSKSPANKSIKPTGKGYTKDRGVIYVKHSNALSCYLGACGGLDNIKDMSECSEQTGGYWWKVLANDIEEKLESKIRLSDIEREEMAEDVQALRRADAERLPSYPAPDPSRSMRYQDWFNKKEWSEVQVKHKTMYDAQMKYCLDTYGDMTKHNLDYGDKDIKKTDAWKKNLRK